MHASWPFCRVCRWAGRTLVHDAVRDCGVRGPRFVIDLRFDKFWRLELWEAAIVDALFGDVWKICQCCVGGEELGGLWDEAR